jgi:hypothetical protein
MNYQWQNLAGTNLTRWSRAISLFVGLDWPSTPLDVVLPRMCIPPKNAWPLSSLKEPSGGHRRKNLYSVRRQGFEKQRKTSRLEETDKTWQLNTAGIGAQDPGPVMEKRHCWYSWRNLNGICESCLCFVSIDFWSRMVIWLLYGWRAFVFGKHALEYLEAWDIVPKENLSLYLCIYLCMCLSAKMEKTQ